MALKIREQKLYVSNIEFRKSGEKYFATFNGSFMSSYQNKDKEWVNDDPFFVKGICFNKEANTVLKKLAQTKEQKGFLLVDGKISTRQTEADGKKYTSTELMVLNIKEIESEEDVEKASAASKNETKVSVDDVPF